MNLTFLKSPSDRSLQGLSLSKDNSRLYIKKDLLSYLDISLEGSVQVSIAKTDEGKLVIVNNPYYNNFRITIPKNGNPHIYIKDSLGEIPENTTLHYTTEKTAIGERENVPYLLVTMEEGAVEETIDTEDLN